VQEKKKGKIHFGALTKHLPHAIVDDPTDAYATRTRFF
jgi:hypothetical protein